jgi:glutathione S-transferase
MKLWFSEGSPFARKVRIVLAEKGLDYEKDILKGIRPVDSHRHLHPGLAVPVLQDGGLTLFESNLVVQYLLQTYPENSPKCPHPPLLPTMTRSSHHWEDAKTLAVLETLTSTIVNLKLMRDDGATPDTVPYLKRQQLRIESCLDWLEERATTDGFVSGWFSVMDVNLICAVAYAEKRDVMTLKDKPRLTSIMARFSDRPSVRSTPVGDAPRMMGTRTA